MHADYLWLTYVSLEHMLGIVVACMPTLRPLFISVTESAQNRWRYRIERRPSEGGRFTMRRRFGGQKRGFENIEHGSSDLVPIRPRIQLTHLTEVYSKPRTESDRVPGMAEPVTT